MSGLKAIRRRIASVRNTKQITRAMKLVSAAKLRRAQDAALQGRAFSERLAEVFKTVACDLPADFSHVLFEKRDEVRLRRVIVLASDRGLCGAYNANLAKAIVAEERAGGGADLEFVAVGRKAVESAKRLGAKVVDHREGLPEDATRWPLTAIAAGALGDFSAGRCDEVVVYYTRFVSTMTQTVSRELLLPFGREELERELGAMEQAVVKGLVKYDPAPLAVLAQLVPLLVKTKLYQAALEAKASEHAARMTAMDAATRNADELIDKLRLYYNRARQSAITKELIDIVGGAEAQK